METALKDFLMTRNIPRAVIDLMEYEKIDMSLIPTMEIDELQSYFPKHGDRIAVVRFCRDFNNSSKIKNNLLEKLRKKMKRKSKNVKNSDDSSSLSGNESEKFPKQGRDNRQIEVGWLHNGKQVRTKCGGGTRKMSIAKNSKKKDVIRYACDLFFPNGESKKGHISNMELDLTDFAFNVVDSERTIEELFQQTKLSRIRYYLRTQKVCREGDGNPALSPTNLDENEPATPRNAVYSPLNELIENIFDDAHTENTIEVEYIVSPAEKNNGVLDTNESHELLEANETSLLFPIEDDSNFVNNVETLVLHRGNIFEDMIEAFKHYFYDHGQIKIEMILPNGETEFAEDFGGVLRDALSEFWQTYYEKHTLGTNLKVPYMRHDVADSQLESIAKVLLRGFQCEKYIPIRLAPVFLKTCFGYNFVNEELIQNFLSYISDSESDLVKKAFTNFDEIDFDELVDFLSPFDAKRLPTKNNFVDLITEIAYQELIRKPSHFIRCFEKVIGILKIRVSLASIEEAYLSITPTSKNCLSKIQLQKEDSSPVEMTIFNYLKKFIKESDEKTRAAFLRFTTGSDLAIKNISVSFIDSSGYSRSPIAHTCSGLLELPSSYENFVTFRSELNSLLHSNIWIMDIV